MLKVHGALLSDTVTSREFVHTNSISASKIAEKENRVSLTVKSVMNTRYGAGDRTRTGTLSPAVDFESTTSTNSITPAWLTYLLYRMAAANSRGNLHFYGADRLLKIKTGGTKREEDVV